MAVLACEKVRKEREGGFYVTGMDLRDVRV